MSGVIIAPTLKCPGFIFVIFLKSVMFLIILLLLFQSYMVTISLNLLPSL